MDALGRIARDRRRIALGAMAAVFKQRRDEWWPGAEDVPVAAYLASVYATRQLARNLMDDGGEPLDLLDQAAPIAAVLLEQPLS